MTRIDTDALATHLEVALTCAPPETLTALQDTDSYQRRRATFNLAQHLADRLGCFEVTGGRFSGELHLQSVFGWRKLWTYRGEQLR